MELFITCPLRHTISSTSGKQRGDRGIILPSTFLSAELRISPFQSWDTSTEMHMTNLKELGELLNPREWMPCLSIIYYINHFRYQQVSASEALFLNRPVSLETSTTITTEVHCTRIALIHLSTDFTSPQNCPVGITSIVPNVIPSVGVWMMMIQSALEHFTPNLFEIWWLWRP